MNPNLMSENAALKAQVKQLEKENEKFRAFIKVMPDLALILTRDGTYEDILGTHDSPLYVSALPLLNKNIADLFSEEQTQTFLNVIAKALDTNCIQHYEYDVENPGELATYEARIVPISYGDEKGDKPERVLWMARDVTQNKINQQKIKKLAFFDPLTQLPNRRMLNERLNSTIKTKKISNEVGALLFLDLDNFKRINDSLGHASGDLLLQKVAQRLSGILRSSDTLSRIGGDEFVLLIDSLGREEAIARTEVSVVADKIQQAFTEKFKIDDLSFAVSCSIGICMIDENAEPADIMKFADTAMYSAKTKGGGLFSFYNAKNQTLLERKLLLETEIIKGIERREFCAFFQPQLNINGDLHGAEALIRWNHPTRGLVSPFEFVSIAEQFGLIQQLQDIVLDDICLLVKQLEHSNLLPSDFRVSINISHSQFRSPNLQDLISQITNKHGVDASRIMLEITESMLSHDMDQTVEQMKKIVDAGFQFSIDDFGTGYSNLSRLHSFPATELKIDKSFIDRLDESSGLSIAETIISLGKNLNMNLVAEGVEVKNQLEILARKDVDAIQGYLFSKPLPSDEYYKWHVKKCA